MNDRQSYFIRPAFRLRVEYKQLQAKPEPGLNLIKSINLIRWLGLNVNTEGIVCRGGC